MTARFIAITQYINHSADNVLTAEVFEKSRIRSRICLPRKTKKEQFARQNGLLNFGQCSAILSISDGSRRVWRILEEKVVCRLTYSKEMKMSFRSLLGTKLKTERFTRQNELLIFDQCSALLFDLWRVSTRLANFGKKPFVASHAVKKMKMSSRSLLECVMQDKRGGRSRRKSNVT